MGVSQTAWNEPIPFGMVLVKRGTISLGPTERDSLWGIYTPNKDVSIDAFWMDETEITNSEYKQFFNYVRDSILRERLADPAYGGNESFKFTEDRQGNPIIPRLNWKKPIPSYRQANEDERRALESLLTVDALTGDKRIDPAQMNFYYKYFDHTEAAKRRNKINPADRNRNTDYIIDPTDRGLISKDTAYIDENGRAINETLIKPLSSLEDFVMVRLVNIYPDTTCWVNDFTNSYNEPYMKLYFAHPGYNNYPVVGISWEQAVAFCIWRTKMLHQSMKGSTLTKPLEYRLPSEAEWEYAARGGKTEVKFPWKENRLSTQKGCFYANFKPDRGSYLHDGNMIPARVGSYMPNDFGLYDMSGNVAEWTSTVYTESGVLSANDLNPDQRYNAAKEDPYILKRKVVKGGSWKDVGTFLRPDARSYEYQNESRSYIGFRCVRSHVYFTAKGKK